MIGTEFTLRIYRSFRLATDPPVNLCAGYSACPSRAITLPYYQAQDWATEFWETKIAPARFQPYSLWHTEAHTDKFATFNDEGFRVTPNTICTDDAYHIYIFGGSTMWGQGSPDWGTIPAYLQSRFNEQSNLSVCIHNMGQLAFHATQEVIELTNQLQLGIRPDMVIFYDGVNEIGNTITTGKPWIPGIFWRRFEREQVEPISKLLGETHIYQYLTKFLSRFMVKQDNGDTFEAYSDDEADSMVADVIDIYLNNYLIVDGLSRQFNFEYYFFWQPTIVYDKTLTTEEEDIIRLDVPLLGPGYFSDPVSVMRQTYSEIEARANEYENLYYVGNVFNDQEHQIYIDIWHITPEGNEIIAGEIFDIIIQNQHMIDTP